MSKLVLGKGLGALIPTDEKIAGEPKKYRTVTLDRIAPNPMQPRRDFDEAGLRELADSFKANGIMQPLLVQQHGSEYTIIAGERRFRAARMANFEEVPVLLMDDVSDTRMLELALVENIQRENLNAIDLGEAYRTLIERCGLTQKGLAEKVGKSRAAVTNILRLLMLPDSIKNMIREGKLTEGHARTLLSTQNEQEMLVLARRITDESLSVRQIEKATRKKRGRKLIPRRNIPALMEFETYLKRLMGTSVKITPGLKQGKIEIEYYGDEDLERLLDLFRRIES
ncbi:MAG: ParB/RepB/Spo0J family partition protein [candidate division Zixibacteria bacterium]|nr:ParB/RepB/Spo0J family partition protein [candidate division Zixibacteria bacterium]